MATRNIPIPLQLPDGGAYFELADTNFLANDRYSRMVLALPDTGTKIGCTGRFRVPKNYVGTPELVIVWGTTATSGNVVFDFDAKAVADGESLDPSTDDETATATVAAPGTARLAKVTTIALSATYAPDDLVTFKLSRDGATGGGATDTLGATCYVEAAYFQYVDA